MPEGLAEEAKAERDYKGGALISLSFFIAGMGIPIPWNLSQGSGPNIIFLIDVILVTIPLYFGLKYIDLKLTDSKAMRKKKGGEELPKKREEKKISVRSGFSKVVNENRMSSKRKKVIAAQIIIVVFVAFFLMIDIDGDGLNNLSEFQQGVAIFSYDSDSDGLSDGDEINLYDTDPQNEDSDGDYISDGNEVNEYGTDPLDSDSDRDGLDDYEEIYTHKTNPLSLDSDSDGLDDKEEIEKYKTDPSDADTDNDGLNDGDEVELGTDLFDDDTDNDGVKDGVDSNPTIHDWKLMDSDNDGLTDYEEYYETRTERFNSDTDGDGVPDGYDANPLSTGRKMREDFIWEYPDGKTWALTTYVSHDLYVYYSKLDRIRRWSDWSEYALDPSVKNIANTLEKYAKENSFNYYQTVNFVLRFVESLPYEYDESMTDLKEYPRYPLETIVDGAGDCEDTSILFSSILREMNYDNCLVVFTSPVGHAMIGIWGHSNYQGSYSTKDGKNYYFCETTGDGKEMGYLNSQFSPFQAVLYDMDVSNPIEPPEALNFVFNPTADAYIDTDHPSINYGDESYLHVRFYDWNYIEDDYKLSYLTFALSEISFGSTIKNAKLKLYAWYLYNPTVVDIYRCFDTSWGESSITWDNAPSYSSTFESSQTINSEDTWYSWDVTNYVQDVLSTGKITFVLKTQTDGGSTSFYSKEHWSVNPPKLEIELN